MSRFLEQLKDMFWFTSPKKAGEKEESDDSPQLQNKIFYMNSDAEGYEEQVRALSDYIKNQFEEPSIEFNDPGKRQSYMSLLMEVKTAEGTFQLVCYNNGELVLRGDRGLVERLREPIQERLGLELRRV